MRNDYLAVSGAKKSRVVIPDFSGGADYDKDEGAGSLSRALDSFNFDFSGGELKTGYGLKKYLPLANFTVRSAWLFTRYDHNKDERDDIMLATDDAGKLYERHVSQGSVSFSQVEGVNFADVPTYINYRLYGDDVVLMCSVKDGMYVYDGVREPYKVDDAPLITSMALHGERLFVTVGGEKKDLWFSEDLDPTNWDASLKGGGFIEMTDERGDLNRVISFLGYVYVFRERGISRVYASGRQTDFAVTNLFVSGGRIYPGSVTVCGDRVLFLATDGLYAFDGANATKILGKVTGVISSGERCASAYRDGKYYLSFRRDYTTQEEPMGCENEYANPVNNMLLVLEIATGKYSLSRGLDITGFTCADDAGVVAITSRGETGTVEKCGRGINCSLKKVWVVPKTDMGTADKKTVREIRLFTKSAVKITLKSDVASLEVNFTGGRDVQRKRVSFSGRRIGMEISSYADDVLVSRPSLIVTHGGF